MSCLACGGGTQGRAICSTCHVPYSRAWCVGDRVESLRSVIEQYKFYRAREASQRLVELLDATLPELPANTIIVPIPTLRSHVRIRGYDHMDLIAQGFAAKRGLNCQALLQRVTSTTQVGARRHQRIEQARQAFGCNIPLSDAHTYLIIDDVVTTGATLRFAARTLKSAGAETVWVAALSRQPSA